MKVLELFSGTKSFGKAAESLGHEVFSVNVSAEFEPSLVSDIMDVSFDELPANVDIIWASPPCTCFSVASIGTYWEKEDKLYKPKREAAVDAVRIIERTLDIITYYVYGHSDGAVFYMENPRAMLRKLPVVDGLLRRTVTYCQYGFDRMKPTDIFTNDYLWKPRPPCKAGSPCHISAPRGSLTGTQGRSMAEKWSVPEELCLEVLGAAERFLAHRRENL